MFFCSRFFLPDDFRIYTYNEKGSLRSDSPHIKVMITCLVFLLLCCSRVALLFGILGVVTCYCREAVLPLSPPFCFLITAGGAGVEHKFSLQMHGNILVCESFLELLSLLGSKLVILTMATLPDGETRRRAPTPSSVARHKAVPYHKDATSSR